METIVSIEKITRTAETTIIQKDTKHRSWSIIKNQTKRIADGTKEDITGKLEAKRVVIDKTGMRWVI